ncbi:hypothetical protein [Nannocystis sp.]|uniref:hypothetical protein n=1 Tax=Nannocystis sp. TaxID=1962667 RepID=UPI0025DE2D4A|nr:hypothetical protein [Nannocystis sp.]MBK7825122.1 hypothetical protein [Nannocystis sp.]
MTARTAPVLWAMSLLLASACAKRAAHDSSMAPGEYNDASDDLAALEQQLGQREDQLQAIGVATPPRGSAAKTAGDLSAGADATGPAEAAEPATASAPVSPTRTPTERKPDASGDRCVQVCDITTAICELEDQICGLLPRHPGDARYQAACDRSNADCQLATEACHACSAT